MGFRFTKMHGLGNDFVIIDAVTQSVEITRELVLSVASRHYGVGCDQLLVIARTTNPAADFLYRIFNTDGSEVAQCGNGARCVGRYVFDRGLSKAASVRLETQSRVIEVTHCDQPMISVDIGVPVFLKAAHADFIGAVDVGNPHIVTTVTDFDRSHMEKMAKGLDGSQAFPEGVNINFMRVNSPAHIDLQVIERGSGPTQACGSGACAAVAVGHRLGMLGTTVDVDQPGGQLRVCWSGGETPMVLSGPAAYVFDGEWLQ